MYFSYYSAQTVNLPNVADSVTEGKVLEVVKSILLSKVDVGDWVDQDETVAQLE